MLNSVRVKYKITDDSPAEFGLGIYNESKGPNNLICIIPDYATSYADIPRTVYDFKLNPTELIKKRQK